LTITGPRHTGKTTLTRALFPEHTYLSLEDPDTRMLAKDDPRSFFSRHQGPLILDEIQRVPELTSYLQGIVDDPKNNHSYVITGSHSQLLIEAVSQSLAGRTRILELLPFSWSEIKNFSPELSLNEVLFHGGYPRIYEKKLNPTTWHKDYFKLYVEKDARQIFNIRNLDLFERFMPLLAERVGQLINYESLANEVAASAPSIRQWLSVLESSYITYKLKPHFKKFNNGLEANYYFWRDQHGHEVDLIEDLGNHLVPTEVKLSSTPHTQHSKNILYFNKLQKQNEGNVIYNGDAQERKGIHFLNWSKL